MSSKSIHRLRGAYNVLRAALGAAKSFTKVQKAPVSSPFRHDPAVQPHVALVLAASRLEGRSLSFLDPLLEGVALA